MGTVDGDTDELLKPTGVGETVPLTSPPGSGDRVDGDVVGAGVLRSSTSHVSREDATLYCLPRSVTTSMKRCSAKLSIVSPHA